MKILSTIDKNGKPQLRILYEERARVRSFPAEKVNCSICDEMFVREIKGEGISPNLYCSVACGRESIRRKTSQKVFVKCSFCGTEVLKRSSKLKGFNYCNRSCQGKARRLDGGFKEAMPAHYGSGAKAYRKKAMGALGYECADCGLRFKPLLVVHHLDGDRNNNNLANLKVLCVQDHALRHMVQDESSGEWSGFFATQTPDEKLEKLRHKALVNVIEEIEKNVFVKPEKKNRQTLPAEITKKALKAGVCAYCEKEIAISTPGRQKKYCNLQCSAAGRRNQVCVKCDCCGISFERRRGSLAGNKFYFCKPECKNLAQKMEFGFSEMWPSTYKNGERARYRKTALDVHGRACVDCGISFEPLLRAHHIDGNRKNNAGANLEVLCAQHHALRHLKKVDGEWLYAGASLTPRDQLRDLLLEIGKDLESARFPKVR